MTPISVISDRIINLVNDIPEQAIKNLINAIESGEEITKFNMEQITGISGTKKDEINSIVFDPNLDRDKLNGMLDICMRTRKKLIQEDKIELVWTGPNKIGMGLRNTKPVMIELLNSATPSEQVIIVDYRITSNAEEIVSTLKSCLEEGVEIIMILNNDKENARELRKCFTEKNFLKPKIFSRSSKEDIGFYKIHAKVLIVGDKMLLGSANMTELGTEVNFEIGLLVEGPTVKKMKQIIKKLIDDEYFTEAE